MSNNFSDELKLSSLSTNNSKNDLSNLLLPMVFLECERILNCLQGTGSAYRTLE